MKEAEKILKLEHDKRHNHSHDDLSAPADKSVKKKSKKTVKSIKKSKKIRKK